jgi:hypothetical protein
VVHRLHAGRERAGHWDTGLAPGGTLDWLLVNPCTVGAGLYDHDYGTDAAVYIVDLPPQ